MYISKVSLVNYRNFENSYFLFNKGIYRIFVFILFSSCFVYSVQPVG